VKVAKAAGYVGAGTVEFLVEGDEFFFLEMNTRLQVEHPVTEAVTGVDLVEWQLRVAADEPLPLRQDQLVLAGHAIEVRVYAEDPSRGYLPQTGRIVRLRAPASGEHVRVDSGVQEGDIVSHHYDPMLAKLIVQGADRPEALRHLARALESYELAGVRTNLPLLAAVAAHPGFAAADIDTSFLEEHAAQLIDKQEEAPSDLLCLAVTALIESRAAQKPLRSASDPWSPWDAGDAFRLNEIGFDVIHLRHRKRELDVVARFAEGRIELEWAGQRTRVEDATLEGDRIRAQLDGVWRSASFVRDGESLYTLSRGRCLQLELINETAEFDEDAAVGGAIHSPMPGRVIEVLTHSGEQVSAGQILIRLEAMKMEHALAAPISGVVEQLSATVGQQVEEGSTLLVVT
jgi:3-methylcrotonyl-CoA carboxylase alpha subunit